MIKSGEIMFEQCRVVFRGNHGTISGGIEMYPGTKVVLNDNAYVEFSDNIGENGGALFLRSSSAVVLMPPYLLY